MTEKPGEGGILLFRKKTEKGRECIDNQRPGYRKTLDLVP
jgi:hypothetical protein